MSDSHSKKRIKTVGNYSLKLDEKKIKHDETSTYYPCYELNHKTIPLIAKSISTADFPNNMALIKMLYSFEYKRFKQLKNPHILKILNFLETPKNIYLIIENFEGSLLDYIALPNANQNKNVTKKLEEREALMLLEMIVDAMLSIHSEKIIHCDLKPANFILKQDCIQVTGFLLAKFNNEISPINSMKNGTPAYMAPEVWDSDDYDGKVDVWSVGVLFYQLLAGEVPFTSDNIENLEGIIKNQKVDLHSLDISVELKHLLTIMLQKDPRKRADFDEIYNQIKIITNGEERNSIIQSNPRLKRTFEKNSKMLETTKRSNLFNKYNPPSHITEESLSPNRSDADKPKSMIFEIDVIPIIEDDSKNQLIKENCSKAEMYFEYEKKLIYILKTVFDDFGKYIDLKSEEDKFFLGVATFLLNKLWMIIMKQRMDKFEKKEIDNNFSQIFYDSAFFQTLKSQLNSDFLDESDNFESWCEEILELTPKISANKEIKLLVEQKKHESNKEFEQIYVKYVSETVEYLKAEKEKTKLKYKKEYMILAIELNYCKSEKNLVSEFPFDEKREEWMKKFDSFDGIKTKKDKELENMMPK